MTKLSLNVFTVLASDPTEITRFFAIHTFDVPSDIDVKMGVTIHFEFTQPSDWDHLDELVPPVVPVVTGERAIDQEACTLFCILSCLAQYLEYF